MRKISVGDVMTRNFVSVSPKASLYECAKTLAKGRVNSLLVVDGKKLVGFLTARDVLWTITKKSDIDLNSVNVMDIATRKVAVIKPSADISQALKKMKSLNFRRLPVLSSGELIGVVTLKDILAIEPELYVEMISLMDMRNKEQKMEKVEGDELSEGICENCGEFSELLNSGGQLLCGECREELY